MSEPESTPVQKPEFTPLHDLHKQLGAKFGPFAGYEMPLFYPAGIIAEHKHTREKAGLFDISHMMHVEIEGSEARQLVERLCPVETASQQNGQARYTFLLNDQAGIIDDLIVTRLSATRFLLVCNAGCADKDWQHINDNAGGIDATITRKPRGFIALQGPDAHMALAKKGIITTDLSFMTAKEMGRTFISRTGYTGEDGFEIAMDEEAIAEFAEDLLRDSAVMAIGLGARDSLRLEAGLSLYGQDLDEETTPMEAGLTWAIPKTLREGGPFMGADALAQAIKSGRKRKRIGLIPEGKAPVRAGTIIRDKDGNEVGKVTSGGFGPSVDHPVALAMISADADDSALVAEVRNREIPVKIAKLPFVKHSYKN